MADPFYTSRVLIALNESGPDGGTTFTDFSQAPHTLAAVGNAQWDTAKAPTGQTSSLLCDGVGDYVETADSTDWDFGVGDFVVEGFLFVNAVGAGTFTAIVATNPEAGGSWGCYYNNSTKVFSFFDGATLRVSTGVVSTSAFIHFAVARTSGTMEQYIDGTRVFNAAVVGNINDAGQPLRLGADNSVSNNSLNGWLCSVRITKGSNGGYTGATITVPSLPYPTSAIDPPVANFTGVPTSGNSPLSVQFTDSSTNTPTSWAWTFGDGGTSTLQNPSHSYGAAGSFTVGLTATNAAGSDIETKPNYITVTSTVDKHDGKPWHQRVQFVKKRAESYRQDIKNLESDIRSAMGSGAEEGVLDVIREHMDPEERQKLAAPDYEPELKSLLSQTEALRKIARLVMEEEARKQEDEEEVALLIH